MKRFLTVLVLMVMGLSAFAYDGFRFDDSGKFPKCERTSMGTGNIDGCRWLAQDLGYDLSTMTEVVVDRDAYCLLYNFVEGHRKSTIENCVKKGIITKTQAKTAQVWGCVETEEYVGFYTSNGYWVEYHLFKK